MGAARAVTPAEASSVLDEAYERIAAAGFELDNGFVNHGAMVCEALAALGLEGDIAPWARRFARIGQPVTARFDPRFDWRGALGDGGTLPEWLGWFRAAVETQGWPAVVGEWVPRLMPGLSTKLFHGAIRTAHALRAVAESDTAPRRQELAAALGYWASRYHRGLPAGELIETEDAAPLAVRAAARAARAYLEAPSIVRLHGVTSAMALELLIPHVSEGAAAAGLAQLRTEHDALFPEPAPPQRLALGDASEGDEARAAASSRDPHQVKLVEACRRGTAFSGDPAFARAAAVVTGLHRRSI